MTGSVLLPDKDPLGAMLKDYYNGDKTAYVRVESPVLDMSKMRGKTMFRDEFSDIEQTALGVCRGRILDVGAGSGCHSLALQKAGADVTALDISPGCMAVLEKRRVEQRIFSSLFSLENQRFTTLLMLMNGIGICGSIEGLNFFFQKIRSLLSRGGQVVVDSTDLSAMYTRQALVPGETDTYYGETQFTMSYGNICGDPFDWLYIDYATLAFYAQFHGWQCEQVMTTKDKKFLARIF
ncbi:MAG: methyltransferase domain-containing protein [Desulfobacter sp.]|nr:methyltransferase domain-containing protein [Desulfobacter sp.]WDP84677.1 MAG: methyltransferase domain-containing protein [Desulfobacter sp.]